VRLDVPTIAAVAAGGVGLVAALVFLRFCGDLGVPAKPPRPSYDDLPEKVARDMSSSVDVYVQTVGRDALTAGVPKPSIEDMGRAYTWRTDRTRRVLEAGGAPIEVAGLRLSAIHHRIEGSEALFSLVIENPGTSAVAYSVDTEVSSGNALCQNRTLLPHNGNVIAAGGKQVRGECVYKKNLELYVERVESAEIPPLAAFYLSLVPPQALGAEERVGGGHRPSLPAGVVGCNVSIPQSVRSGLEDGTVQWRDLADFYARHNCGRYAFVDGYRAFTSDGERSLPATGD
jgi:hypothetical protein